MGTNDEHSDEVFVNLALGIRAGKTKVHKMDAETSVLRCKFSHRSVAGVRIQSFNALDWFIWDSEFDDCAVGITNDPGAGHFHAYRNIFRRSTVADITLRNAEYFGIHHNLSLNSKRFFEARDIGGWAVDVTLQGNTVIDPVDPVAFDIRNVGPILLLDNAVRSRPQLKEGPVVVMDGNMVGSYVAVGNSFTVPNPIKARDRYLEEQTHIVAAKEIVLPELPGAVVPPHKMRKVFEVAPGANAEAIQTLIDQAMAFKGKRPVLHFPAASYGIEKTITVPAGLDVQFVGDVGCEAMRLQWTGPADGVMFRLEGPTRATFRDMSLTSNGKGGIGVLVTNADQPGARISGDGFMPWSNTTGVLTNGLAQTDISFRTFYHQGNKLSIKIVGNAEAAAGKPVPARTCPLRRRLQQQRIFL